MSRRDFLPFGEEVVPDAANLRTDAPLKYNGDGVRQKFTGYQHDEETGLDFAEARMYENRHGRFTAPDPLLASASAADPQTFNRYIYTGNNPVNITDPSGLQWCRNADGTVGFQKDTPCTNEQTDITDRTLVQSGDDGGVDSKGRPILRGDSVYFDPNGTAINVSPPPQPAADAGTTVQDAVEELPISSASEEVARQIAQTELVPCVPAYQCAGARSFGNAEPMTIEQEEDASRALHLGLAGCGFIFDGCDLADGAISGLEGDYLGMGMSLPSAVPFLGIIPGGAKMGRYGADAAGYTKSSLAIGRAMHRAYRADEVILGVAEKEFRLPSGKRINFIDFRTNTIYELKPFNPRGLREGGKQLAAYKAELESMAKYKGITWKTVLDTY